jgi:hypothetical protein
MTRNLHPHPDRGRSPLQYIDWPSDDDSDCKQRTPSPPRRRRSLSLCRRHRTPSPPRRERRHRTSSPVHHRRHRTPSPVARYRHHTPSPVARRRHRTPSPIHHRRHRTQSPVARRRHRTPSPSQHRRPASHTRRRSPSLRRRRTPSPPRRNALTLENLDRVADGAFNLTTGRWTARPRDDDPNVRWRRAGVRFADETTARR